MLTYLLALVVGLSSFALYMSAFFYPELYRKGDLAWSGVGLFYALVLWFSAERITGSVLLGQIAGVSLIGWLGWQVWQARGGQPVLDQSTGMQTGLEKIISPEQRSKITAQLNQQAGKVKEWGQALLSTAAKSPVEESSTTYQPLKPEDFGRPPVPIATPAIADIEAKVAPLIDEIAATPVSAPASVPPAVRESAKPGAVITDILKSVTSLFNKPKKNTSTYVRKSAQEQTDEALAATKGTVAGAVEALTDPAKEVKAGMTEAAKASQDALAETSQTAGETLTAMAATAPDAIAAAPHDPVEPTTADQSAPGESGDQVTVVVTAKVIDAQSATEDIVEKLLDNLDDTP